MRGLIGVGLLGLAVGGCTSTMMSTTGKTMSAYTVTHLTPFVLGSPDTGMACAVSEANGNLLLSFERVESDNARGAVSTLVSAGACAEELGWEAELRGLRALKRGDAGEAQDARYAEFRAHATAASRFYRAWGYLTRAEKVRPDSCPELIDDDDQDRMAEVAWLTGHLGAIQAVQHDRAAKGTVGVPTDLPQQVARSIRCLDNERWWGIPAALQAAVWLGVPGSAPEGADPWKQLDEAAALGAKAGLRVALAVRAQAADAVGDEARLKEGIRAFVAAGATPPPARWRMFDLQAGLNVRYLSDRIWTQATGHRTPPGELGTFPDDKKEAPPEPGFFDAIDEPAAPAAQQNPEN
ncbi:MAG: hypothetical protein KC549_08975 [Myxococcales bacterium]|nr:hypothetical protein [Myxococcales bacterium]MCB9549435.1 hypothetical protein [Myxococcales bacterium]